MTARNVRAQFGMFPVLKIAAPRLHVRSLVAADAPAVSEIFADKQTRRWLPPTHYGPEDASAWCTEIAEERRSSGAGDHYAVVRREDECVVGVVWTRRTDWQTHSTEINFALSALARGFGVAAEAIDALAIALILEHGFQRVEMRIAPGNVAARRTAEKAGFVYEGLLRNAGNLACGRVDLEMWSLIVADLRGGTRER